MKIERVHMCPQCFGSIYGEGGHVTELGLFCSRRCSLDAAWNKSPADTVNERNEKSKFENLPADVQKRITVLMNTLKS